MSNEKLTAYVLLLIERGIAQEEIAKQLTAVGWSAEEIEDAYTDALVAHGVPVPQDNVQLVAQKKSSTVEIVLNFFSFILLGIVVIALGTLLFEVISTYFPDPLMYRYAYREQSMVAMHYAIAALVIGFPLYYASMKMWFKRFRGDENKQESKLTTWITYIVLLIAAVIVVGDLITVVFYVLQGELTIRFILKALVILMLASSVFGFYFLERRKIQYKKDIAHKTFQSFGVGVSAVVAASIVMGFFASGSPATQREYSLDNERSDDLFAVARCIEDYARTYERLPQTLDELGATSAFSYCANRTDPETNMAYEYNVIVASRTEGSIREGEFELCAVFARATGEEVIDHGDDYPELDKWHEHEQGRSCDREVVVLENLNDLSAQRNKEQL